MAISGINGSNNILMSSAKLRVDNKMITKAEIIGTKGNYKVQFTNKEAEWNGNPVVLCSSRNPYEPKIFKSIDGAAADVIRAGLKDALIILSE